MYQQKVYVCRNKDNGIVANSRSGGVFTALSDRILECEGAVYGCAMLTPVMAAHIRATDEASRNLQRGSKYIQSDKGDSFALVESDLSEGKCVLFSGTPCEIAALKKYLDIRKVSTERLLTVDIVCHGVPSPKIWREYLQYIAETKHAGAAISSVDFRNKKDHGWKAHVETVKFADGSSYTSRRFANLFYSHLIVRPSCFCCPYKSLDRISDITLGDCWGIEDTDSPLNDDKGTSLVLVNSEKGAAAFEEASSSLHIEKQDTIGKFIQRPLLHPDEVPLDVEAFWNRYADSGFRYIAKVYIDKSTFDKIKGKIRYLVHKNDSVTATSSHFYNNKQNASITIDDMIVPAEKEHLPVMTTDERWCCGCNACAQICPTGALVLKEDAKGFSYPTIDDKSKCIGCGRCAKACAFKDDVLARLARS